MKWDVDVVELGLVGSSGVKIDQVGLSGVK